MTINVSTMNKRVVIAILAFALFLGIENGAFMYIVLKIAAEYSLDQAHMGFLASVKYGGDIVGALAIGIVSDRLGRKTAILISAALLCLCAFLSTIMQDLSLLTACILGIGLGVGCSLNAGTAALAVIDPGRSGKYLSLFHGLISSGSIAGPLLGALLISGLGLSWRAEYIIIALTMVLTVIVIGMIPFRGLASCTHPLKTTSRPAAAPPGMFGVITFGTFFCIFLYMCMENALTFFTDSYFTIVLDAPAYSAIALALFSASMAISRIGISRFYRYRNMAIPVCFAGCGILTGFIAFSHSSMAVTMILGLAGLFFGPIYAFLQSINTDQFPKNAGVITSLFMLCGGTGGMVSPLIMGRLSDTTGLRPAFLLLSVICFAGFACYIAFIYRKTIHKEVIS